MSMKETNQWNLQGAEDGGVMSPEKNEQSFFKTLEVLLKKKKIGEINMLK